jgi:hypothetical protein
MSAVCYYAPYPLQDTFFLPGVGGGNIPGSGVQLGFFVLIHEQMAEAGRRRMELRDAFLAKSEEADIRAEYVC